MKIHKIALTTVLVKLILAAGPSEARNPDKILDDLRTEDLSVDETLRLLREYVAEERSTDEITKKVVANFNRVIAITETMDQNHCDLNYLADLLKLEKANWSLEGSIGQFIAHNRVELYKLCQGKFDDQLELAIVSLSPEIRGVVEDYEREKEATRNSKRKKKGKQELEGHILGFIERKHEQDGNTHSLATRLNLFCVEILQKLDSFVAAVDDELEPMASDELSDWLHTARECNNLLEPEERR